MNDRRGFTIIELIVVITVLGIISSLSVIGYVNIQKQSRDSQRMSSAIVVSESLEKYFSQHGEYPSVANVTATNADTVKQLLGITNIDSLVVPNAPAGTTVNAWKAGAATATNKLAYTTDTDTAAACLTGTAPTDVCIDYRIQYYLEQTGTVKTIISRNKALAAPVIPPPAAPGATTVTVALSGSDALATSTVATCTAPAAPEYSYRSRVNDSATWSAYSAWSITRTGSVPAAQGSKYGFQFKARCIDNGLISSESPASAEGTYIRLITTPAAPSVVISTSGDISTWTWSVTTCPAGTTARYQYRFVADWGYTSPWYGPYTGLYTRTWDTSSQGYEYIVQIQTHCYTAFTTSNWSGTGQANYIRTVSAPGPITFGIYRGAPNIVYVSATSSCHPSVFLYSRADLHTWDYPWEDNGQYGWYATTHGGTWVGNSWAFRGNPTEVGAINNVTNFNSGSGWNMATDLRCRNSTTGRQSTSTGRVESARMNLP